MDRPRSFSFSLCRTVFVLIQLALMDPTKLMGVMPQGHTHVHSSLMQEDPNVHLPHKRTH